MCDLIGVIEEIGRRGEEEVSVEWRIPNFPSLLHGGNCWYGSPEFRFGNERWRLIVWPNWKIEALNPASGWVRLSLDRCDGGPPLTFRFSAGIRGSGGVEKSREGEKEFKDYDNYYHWDDFCSRSHLLEHRTRLMPGDTLTITCVLKRPAADRGFLNDAEGNNEDDDDEEAGDGDDDNDDDDDDDDDDDEENDEDDCEDNDDDKASKSKNNVKQQNQVENAKKRFETLVKDFGKLLSGGENSDVTMQVGDVEFKVHRNILSARSPVLSAMLKHETEERAMNRITIEDCEPEVFKEYLQYLYTGSVGLLSEQNVFHLYRVADKYLADELKEQCLMHIQDTLSAQTFCDTLKVALTHGESGLLEQAIDFATDNIRSIIRTVEWQNFICEYPTEANEVLIKSLGPPCACRKSKC